MTKKNIVIIDYGLCNLRSVYNAFRHLGHESVVTSDPALLFKADAVVLPGVGAFEDGMRGLREKNFIGAINDYVKTGRPFLGICLGMELLLSKSFEFGEHEGLNLIPGEVVPFQNRLVDGRYDFKIPHIGWNGLLPGAAAWEKTPLEGLDEGEEMYFVHSFYARPDDPKYVLAETDYADIKFCSVIARDNIYGCQFHPEKSAQAGLKILNNFVRLTYESRNERQSQRQP